MAEAKTDRALSVVKALLSITHLTQEKLRRSETIINFGML